MKRKLAIPFIIFLLVVSFSVWGAAAEQNLSWDDFIGSLKNILGPSIVVSQSGSNSQFITRIDAARAIIDALSYNDLYDYIDTGSVRFQDVQNLVNEEKKAVILATQLKPSLFTGDVKGRFRPNDPLTIQEFSFLKEKIKTYARGNISFEFTKIVEPGVMLIVKKWGFGEPTSTSTPSNSGPGASLQVGAFSERNRADNAATFLKELGYAPSIVEE